MPKSLPRLTPCWCRRLNVLVLLETPVGSRGFRFEGGFAFRGKTRWKSWLDNSGQSIFPRATSLRQNQRDAPSLRDYFPHPLLFPSGLHQSTVEVFLPTQFCPYSSPLSSQTLAVLCMPVCTQSCRTSGWQEWQSDHNTHRMGKSQKSSSVTLSINSLSPRQCCMGEILKKRKLFPAKSWPGRL